MSCGSPGILMPALLRQSEDPFRFPEGTALQRGRKAPGSPGAERRARTHGLACGLQLVSVCRGKGGAGAAPGSHRTVWSAALPGGAWPCAAPRVSGPCAPLQPQTLSRSRARSADGDLARLLFPWAASRWWAITSLGRCWFGHGSGGLCKRAHNFC